MMLGKGKEDSLVRFDKHYLEYNKKIAIQDILVGADPVFWTSKEGG